MHMAAQLHRRLLIPAPASDGEVVLTGRSEHEWETGLSVHLFHPGDPAVSTPDVRQSHQIRLSYWIHLNRFPQGAPLAVTRPIRIREVVVIYLRGHRQSIASLCNRNNVTASPLPRALLVQLISEQHHLCKSTIEGEARGRPRVS